LGLAVVAVQPLRVGQAAEGSSMSVAARHTAGRKLVDQLVVILSREEGKSEATLRASYWLHW
jgi:uncharacterized phosphosugar-binding protein